MVYIDGTLTSAELEFIKQLALPNKVISLNLGISEAAISMKQSRIAAKLGVENRSAIIIKTLRLGLVTIDQLIYRSYNGETNTS